MLQRQVISKQLQELQRRQQFQELGNNSRNLNYAHQMSSVKRDSGVQFSPAANEMPVQDSSRMCTDGDLHMIQHNGPSGFALPQNHDLALQFDVSSHGIHAPNADEKLNNYFHHQGLANRNQFTLDSSLAGQRYNFPTEHIKTGDKLLLSNQEDNLFGQVQAGGSDSGILSCNYLQQRFDMQKNSSFWDSGKGNDSAASLEPLEQKILYNTEDFSWESTLGRNSKMISGGFDKTIERPSMQSGSWSALMQSAVAESSSSDAGVQEEWSGLSFQNPEQLSDGEKLQNDWVDRNLPNDSSPSSNLHDVVQNIDNFSNFQSAQYRKHKEEYQPKRGSKFIQESPNIWPGEHMDHSYNDAHQNHYLSSTNDSHPHNNFSGLEYRGTFWLQGITSDHVSGIQKNNNQVNERNSRRHAVKPENVDGVSNGENVIASSEGVCELFNSDPVSFNFGFSVGPRDHQLPQVISSATPPSNDIVNDYVKYPHSAPLVQNQMATDFPVYSAISLENFEKKVSNSSGLEVPVLQNQNVGFPPSLRPGNHSSFLHEYQQLDKENFVYEGSTEITNSTSLLRRAQEQEFMRKHLFGSNSTKSGSLITYPHNQPYNQAEVITETPSFPARNIEPFSHSLNQNHSPSHQMLSTRNDESDGVHNVSPKYANINNDHLIANARNLLLNPMQSNVRAKSDSYAASQLDVFWSGKASSMPHNQNYAQPVDIFRQNRPTIDSPNLAYQSHISSQTAPSWLGHYETLKNGQILPMFDATAQDNARLMGCRILQEHSLIMQVDFPNTQERELCRSTAATSVASNKFTTPCVLPTYQNLPLSMPKKRKFAELDMVSWHEKNHGQLRLQDISSAECIWAQASNRKPEKPSNAAVDVGELVPVIRAKKRLISTTQLMQQIFRPIPVIILCSDASLNGDSVAYVAARLELGDAWCLTGQWGSDANNMSVDKLKTSKKTKACKFSEIVKAIGDRIEKVEADLSRVDNSLSFVDFKLEARELERFSTNNRFARFHSVRVPPINASHASSSILFNPALQKYVIPLAMPEIVAEVQDCLCL